MLSAFEIIGHFHFHSSYSLGQQWLAQLFVHTCNFAIHLITYSTTSAGGDTPNSSSSRRTSGNLQVEGEEKEEKNSSYELGIFSIFSGQVISNPPFPLSLLTDYVFSLSYIYMYIVYTGVTIISEFVSIAYILLPPQVSETGIHSNHPGNSFIYLSTFSFFLYPCLFFCDLLWHCYYYYYHYRNRKYFPSALT